jgi:hypothetical protein
LINLSFNQKTEKMKSLFKVFVLLSILLYSCNETDLINPVEKNVGLQNEVYFRTNVTIFDARVRGVSLSSYVKELFIVDFGENPQYPQSITFQNVKFTDDGLGLDEKSGDGIYTSIERFTNKKTLDIKEGEVISVLNAPILDRETFAYFDELEYLEKTYSLRSSNLDGARAQIITCQASIAVGTNDCAAARWGWCSDCCVIVSSD